MSPLAIPVERHEAGYRPTYSYRVEDCYIWRDPKWHTSEKWQLRINNTFTTHRTLRAARIEAARQMGIA